MKTTYLVQLIHRSDEGDEEILGSRSFWRESYARDYIRELNPDPTSREYCYLIKQEHMRVETPETVA